MTPLRAYLNRGDRGLVKRLARDADVATSAISRAAAGIPVSLRTAILIDKATNGEVPAETLAPEDANIINYLRSAA